MTEQHNQESLQATMVMTTAQKILVLCRWLCCSGVICSVRCHAIPVDDSGYLPILWLTGFRSGLVAPCPSVGLCHRYHAGGFALLIVIPVP